MEESRERIYKIPKNYQTGISILGTTYETVYVLQAASLIIPGWIIAFYILPRISFLSMMDFSAKLSVAILWSAIFGFLCINGIQEKPLFQYIKDVRAFKKRWKKGVYNPELSLTSRPLYVEKEDKELLPRDRLFKLIDTYREKQKNKDINDVNKLTDAANKDEVVYIFDDNMDAKAYKKYLKKQRKEMTKLNGRDKGKSKGS